MSNDTIVRTSISLPEPIHKKGLRNAKKRVRNFSSYLADLILQDSKQLDTSAPVGAEVK